MSRIILINGKKQSKLSVFNRLVQFGDGLFETCLVADGQLILAEQHFQRLEKGAERLHINTVKRSLWLEDISKAVGLSGFERVVVKIILSRGESERGYGFEKNIEPIRVVIVSEEPKLPEKYDLGLCHSGYSDNQLLAEIKHCNRLEQILARINIQGHDCIMLDPQGLAISVSQGNLFAIKNGVLLTPRLDKCGIEGTRRKVVIGLAKALGILVEVCPLSVQELLESDEIFITNSVIGIKPVRTIGMKSYSRHTITNELIKLLEAHITERKNSITLKTFIL